MPSLEEARERVIHAAWTFGGPNRGPGGRTSLEITTKALAAFENAIRVDARAEDEQRIAALVEAAIFEYAPKHFTMLSWKHECRMFTDAVLCALAGKTEE